MTEYKSVGFKTSEAKVLATLGGGPVIALLADFASEAVNFDIRVQIALIVMAAWVGGKYMESRGMTKGADRESVHVGASLPTVAVPGPVQVPPFQQQHWSPPQPTPQPVYHDPMQQASMPDPNATPNPGA